jgi:steroid 5-alpha reductase family enzyme
MTPRDRRSLFAIPVLVVLGGLTALAGSRGGASVGGVPVFGLCVALAYLIQWAVFVPSFLRQTEKLFDLTGSLTYLSLIALALALGHDLDARAMLLSAMVVIWALRLGTFLYRRIQRAGKDDRFDELKPSFSRFLAVWTIQALWVTNTCAAALIGITTTVRVELDVWAAVGFSVWAVGFGVEVVADAQKSRFSANESNRGTFIQTGLWARSRHPNYFGEIMLWVGVLVTTLPVLRGWQWIALLSPAFVALLLMRVSGIPLLEKKADERWGGQADYEAYKKRTPVLIPRLF